MRPGSLVGAVCGLTWAAGFRGWMAELAEGESSSSVTWMTLVLVLLPGTVIGALLGWSAYLRAGCRTARACPVGVRGGGSLRPTSLAAP